MALGTWDADTASTADKWAPRYSQKILFAFLCQPQAEPDNRVWMRESSSVAPISLNDLSGLFRGQADDQNTQG